MTWKKILIGEWSWKRPFAVIGWVYLSLLVIALFFADRFIFQPPEADYPTDRRDFLTLSTEGGDSIAAYYRPASVGMPTLLWSHGNAEDLSSVHADMNGLNQIGFGFLAYDYPGYGESSGKPNEKSCYRAIEAAYRHLVEVEKISPAHLILAGQSVGSGPTCWLAAREKHGGVLLIAPFLSAFRTVTRIPLFPGDRFQNIDRIKDIATPLLIIHGEADKVIPFSQGKKLFELSPSSDKTFLPIPKAGHNDLYLRGRLEIFAAIWKFGEAVLPR